MARDWRRYHYTDPLTGERASFWGSETDRAAKRRQLDQIRTELRLGVSPAELRSRFQGAGAKSEERKTIGAIWTEYRATLPVENGGTVRAYDAAWNRRLRQWWSTRYPWEVTPILLGDWKRELKRRSYAANSIWAAWNLLKNLLDRVGTNPAQWRGFRCERQTENPRRALTLEDVVRVLSEARAEDETHWARGRPAWQSIALLLAVQTGLRQAELAGLGWDDLVLDGEAETVTVRYQASKGWKKRLGDGAPRSTFPTKGKRVDTLALHPQIAESLRAHRAALVQSGLYRPSGPVFPLPKGEWRNGGVVIRPSWLRKIAKRVGIERDCDAHTLRHTFCTHEARATLKRGGDIREVQRRLRHANVATTLGYITEQAVGLTQPSFPTLPGTYVPALPGNVAIRFLPELGKPLALPPKPEPEVLAPEEKDSFTVMARRYRSGKVPREVLEAEKRAYSRAYQRGKREGLSVEKARIKGKQAGRAVRRAWSNAVKKARTA